VRQNRIWLIGVVLLLGSGTLAVGQEQPKRPPPMRVPEGVKVLRDLEYVHGGHERNRLDMYLPEKADHPMPVIVWIHGGAWLSGSKDRPAGIFFTTKGYALASINYRLSQHAPFPAQIQDCKAAIRWLRANAKMYNLDPDHIGVWGASAGGHLVALLGTAGGVKDLDGTGRNLDQSSRVQAVVDWFGPTDFTAMGGWHDGPESPEARLIGGPVQENREKATKANPITYIDNSTASFLIMHGDRDNTVPLGQSELLAQALKKAGVEVMFRIVEGAGHGGPQFTSPENRKLVEDFFDKHLRRADKPSGRAIPPSALHRAH
jgi:acetyl esterase/lipase